MRNATLIISNKLRP